MTAWNECHIIFNFPKKIIPLTQNRRNCQHLRTTHKPQVITPIYHSYPTGAEKITIVAPPFE